MGNQDKKTKQNKTKNNAIEQLGDEETGRLVSSISYSSWGP